MVDKSGSKKSDGLYLSMITAVHFLSFSMWTNSMQLPLALMKSSCFGILFINMQCRNMIYLEECTNAYKDQLISVELISDAKES